MHSSDETGDDQGRAAPAGGTASDADPVPPPHPAPPYRERIRRASVAAAAQSTVSPADAIDHTATHALEHALHAPQVSFSSAPPAPPEHSGVRARSEDSLLPMGPMPIGGASTSHSALPSQSGAGTPGNARRATPRAWPFATPAVRADGTRNDATRSASYTQVGAGLPANALPANALGGSAQEALELAGRARVRLHTDDARFISRDARAQPDVPTAKTTYATTESAVNQKPDPIRNSPTKTVPEMPAIPVAAPTLSMPPSAAAQAAPVSPGAYSVNPSAKHGTSETSAWSPSSTRPQRAALLRPTDPGTESGRYSVREGSVEYVETTNVPAPMHAAERETGAANVPSAAHTAADDAGSNQARATRSTQPMRRSPLPAAASAASPMPTAAAAGQDAAPATHDDVAAKGFGAEDEDTTQRARRYTPKQRPAQRRGRMLDRGAGGSRITKDERVDLARTLPDIRTTSPGRPRALQTASRLPDAPPPAAHTRTAPVSQPPQVYRPVLHAEASIVVDPSLSVPPPSELYTPLPSPVAPVYAAPQPLPAVNKPAPIYQPLPSDAAALERFMREHAAARGGSGSRLNWNQQETLLIPREMLEGEELKEPHRKRARLYLGIGFALAAVCGVGLAIFVRPGLLAKTITTISAVRSHAPHATLIATEPSGAELLLGGAVLGNTPLTVTCPDDGERLYVVRMHGFVTEMVRVTPESDAAIRLSLTPTNAPFVGQP